MTDYMAVPQGWTVVWKARDWELWCGTYPDKEAAEKEIKKFRKSKREEKVTITARPWSDYGWKGATT